MKAKLSILMALVALSGHAATVLNLPFDADEPPSVVDTSGNGNNGTLSGPDASVSDCFSGGCYDFAGAAEYIEVADHDSLDCTAGITISAWVKPVGLDEYPNVTYLTIAAKSGAYSLSIRGFGNIVFSLTGVGSFITSLQNDHSLFDGAWHHIAASYDGATAAIYVDGRLNSSTAVSGSITTTTTALRIGNMFRGKMDEVRIQNAGISDADALALWLSYSTPRAPRSYYVSSSGNDANDGLSTGAPWKTLAKVYGHQFRPYGFIPGDSILLKRGDTWEGQLATLWLDGATGSNIVFGAYGTGASPKIYGDGRDLTWSEVPGYTGVYEALLGPGSYIRWVYQGESRPDFENVLNWQAMTAGTWSYPYHMKDRIWIRTLDDAPPVGMTVFRMTPKLLRSTHIRIQDIAFESIYSGHIEDCASVTLSNITTKFSTHSGIYWYETTNCLMEASTVEVSGETGIYLLAGLSNVVRNCTVNGVFTNVNGFPNGGGDRGGVGFFQGNCNLVEGCAFINPETGNMSGAGDYWYENDSITRHNYVDGANGFYPHGNNNLVFGNVLNCKNAGNAGSVGICPPQAEHFPHNVYGFGRTGVRTNNYVLNNTFWDARSGLIVYPGAVVKNNIFYGDIGLINHRKYDVDGDSVADFGECDYNLFYRFAPNSATPRFIIWEPNWPDGTETASQGFDVYQAASGQDAHSIYADPLFVSANPATALDFMLSTNSPAIDAGTNIFATGIDYTGGVIPVGGVWDIGAFEFSSEPPPVDPPPAQPTGTLRANKLVVR
jgi:hypothetical protein